MEATAIKTVGELIVAVWNEDVTLPVKEARRLFDGKMFKAERIRVVDNGDDTITFTRSNPVSSRRKHEYVMPDFTAKVVSHLANALSKGKSCNIMLTGPAGTGKTEFVHEVANRMGFAKVYQVNGNVNATTADFLGSVGVKVDPASGQNVTYFDKGALYRAFIEGTEVDGDGNQVLYDGKPKVVGKPAVFFLDEFATVLPEVFLGVFNRPLEIPREEGQSRSLEIPMDGGRVVKSHPGMVIIMSGNTVGLGNSSDTQMGYTAQSNIMDASTLDRFTAVFKFGYNRGAEVNIAMSYLHDEVESDKLMKFRDDIRNMRRNGRISSNITTRGIVGIANCFEVYRGAGVKNPMPEAIRDSVFTQLPEEDVPAWNEEVRAVWGVDLMADERKRKNDYDFF